MSNNNDKPSVNKKSNSVGNISIGGKMIGNLIVGDGNKATTTVNNGMNATDIKHLFDQLYSEIDKRPETPMAVKEDIKAEVQEIQTVVTEAIEKQEKVEENFLSRKFRTIARMAPDILDVVIATIGNPLAGLGVTVKKIADKAKEDAKG